MKITVQTLKKLIKEEYDSIMQEQEPLAEEEEAEEEAPSVQVPLDVQPKRARPVSEHITKDLLKKMVKEELAR